jgi:hypothetical protein
VTGQPKPVIETLPPDDVHFREFAEALIMSNAQDPERQQAVDALAVVRQWIRLAYPDATVECDCAEQRWFAYRDAAARG